MTLGPVKATVQQNPCASVAAVVGSGMALVIWVASVFGLDVPSWAAALIGGAVVSVALAIGSNGIVGLIRYLLYGSAGPPQK